MKYVIAIGLFVAGGLTGYFIGNSGSDRGVVLDESPKTEFITQTVHDTIVQTTEVNVIEPTLAIDSLLNINDSLLAAQDSLINLIDLDSIDTDISISREVLEKSVWIDILVIEENEEGDSLVKEMMGIKESMPKNMLVEFWQSPLNFSGYKLSKSKLVMYGMPSQLAYKLYRNKSGYYLSTQNVFYELKETEAFLSYKEVNKTEVFND